MVRIWGISYFIFTFCKQQNFLTYGTYPYCYSNALTSFKGMHVRILPQRSLSRRPCLLFSHTFYLSKSSWLYLTCTLFQGNFCKNEGFFCSQTGLSYQQTDSGCEQESNTSIFMYFRHRGLQSSQMYRTFSSFLHGSLNCWKKRFSTTGKQSGTR